MKSPKDFYRETPNNNVPVEISTIASSLNAKWFLSCLFLRIIQHLKFVLVCRCDQKENAFFRTVRRLSKGMYKTVVKKKLYLLPRRVNNNIMYWPHRNSFLAWYSRSILQKESAQSVTLGRHIMRIRMLFMCLTPNSTEIYAKLRHMKLLVAEILHDLEVVAQCVWRDIDDAHSVNA
jgi:hypothetical protein